MIGATTNRSQVSLGVNRFTLHMRNYESQDGPDAVEVLARSDVAAAQKEVIQGVGA